MKKVTLDKKKVEALMRVQGKEEMRRIIHNLEEYLKQPEEYFIAYFEITKQEFISKYIDHIKSNIEKI